jgi:hypothetical protein
MTPDEKIGRNLARLRGNRSQKDIADAMRERGWKWSQATVWSIEKGERPLRVAEAADLAQILDQERLGPSLFVQTDAESDFHTAMRQMSAADRSLREAIEGYFVAQGELSLRLQSSPNPAYERAVEDWLSRTPADVAESVTHDMIADSGLDIRAIDAEREHVGEHSEATER